ncbi:CPBP family intramembrane glutamic endopeptidase [Stackebrandtia nassauensis]|uniref:CPBP family intramembrane glutamic endopeptidase n=1 Tax=Stackebrandtia nassauensis TaxID=283811 RepID=UPI0001A39812|nr:CPBP family intramembrane glutamic endopeptidase [Stackebrandtia nassauensis]
MAEADVIVVDMETTTKPKGLAARLLADRHSLPLSIALHLVPGALIVAAYLYITEPFTKVIDYPPFLGWSLALCLVLFPLQLGLMWLGRKQTGRFSTRGVLQYTDKPLSRGKLAAFAIPAFLWFAVVSTALIPFDNVIYENFFTWVPFQGAGGSATAYLDGYSQSVLLTTMLISFLLTGVSLPLIEEIYFRGFLMPRLAHLGWGAPVLSTVLFSIYHLWSPWVVISRIIFFFPGPWLVWKTKDIRVSIGMHVGLTAISTFIGIIAIATGAIG